MNLALKILAGCWLMSLNLMGAAPANDAFENRFTLEGSSIVFTGTLSGATIENHDIVGWPECNCECYLPGAGTVWWEWTAPVSTRAILEVAGYSTNAFRAGTIEVYQGTNALLCNGCSFRLIGCINLDSGRRSFVSFPAIAGEKYQIKVFGPAASFTLQLTATNSPHFLIHPVTQSASVGGSVFLGGLAAGSEPISYQWRFNGMDLLGQNLPILSLDHLSTNQAGVYTLVASNQFGAAASTPAQLFINVSNIHPGLTLRVGDGKYRLGVNGETGRTYRIESSTNLVTWQHEVSFPASLNFLYHTSFEEWVDVVFNTNGAAEFSLQQTGQPRFFRASRYAPAYDECNNNLKKIRFAKELWALANRKSSSPWNTPAPYELIPFMGPLPICPEGGIYSVMSINSGPFCTIPPYRIEEPEY